MIWIFLNRPKLNAPWQLLLNSNASFFEEILMHINLDEWISQKGNHVLIAQYKFGHFKVDWRIFSINLGDAFGEIATSKI